MQKQRRSGRDISSLHRIELAELWRNGCFPNHNHSVYGSCVWPDTRVHFQVTAKDENHLRRLVVDAEHTDGRYFRDELRLIEWFDGKQASNKGIWRAKCHCGRQARYIYIDFKASTLGCARCLKLLSCYHLNQSDMNDDAKRDLEAFVKKRDHLTRPYSSSLTAFAVLNAIHPPIRPQRPPTPVEVVRG